MSQSPAPRIGIIGTGAIGGFYGLLLARAGYDVHFLLRSEYRAVAECGLQLDSAVHGALLLAPVQAYRDAGDMPPCDWLLVGAKTTANTELAPLIAQVAAPGAKVVLLQNGLAVEDELRPLLADDLNERYELPLWRLEPGRPRVRVFAEDVRSISRDQLARARASASRASAGLPIM